MRSERDLVRTLEKAIREGKGEGKLHWLKYHRIHLNLAHTGFEEILGKWNPGQTTPKVEVDLLCVFEDIHHRIDDVMLVAVEMKHFRANSSGAFCDGLDQALAFSLFGFDGLSLWHLFSGDVVESRIQGHASAAKEILQGHNLPLFYLAARVGDDLQLSSYSPAETTGGVDYYLDWMWRHSADQRNPLLQFEEVRKRRRIMKAMLRIP